jgi:hypothetical protein
MELTSRGELLYQEYSQTAGRRKMRRMFVVTSPAVHYYHQNGVCHRAKTGDYPAELQER